MTKVKTLWLSKDPSEADFLVEKAQDTLDHVPGTYLTELEAAALCEAEDWKVIITKFKG